MAEAGRILEEHGRDEEEGRLFMALELAQKEWKLGFSDRVARRPRLASIPGRSVSDLRVEIGRARRAFCLREGAAVISCHEAGRDGFSVHRLLEEVMGCRSLVIDPGSLSVNRRQRRAKTDRLDVLKLLRALLRHAGGEEDVWSVVRVPTEGQEDERQLHRERDRLRRDQRRHRNRIQEDLAVVGVQLEIGRDFQSELGSARTLYGSPVPEELRGRIVREHERLELVEDQLLKVEREIRGRIVAPRTEMDRQAQRLMTLRGIGPIGAWTLVKEFFGWREFKNRRQVAGAAGLVGTPHDTGQSKRERGISKAGNKRVRWLMVQLAWLWVRHQPESKLSRWYEERFGGGASRMRRKGIVALARRLLIDLWRFLEFGVVPEGAILKGEKSLEGRVGGG